MDRKKILLVVLLAAWGLLIVYQRSTQEPPRRVPLKYTKGYTISAGDVQSSGRTALAVRLDLLEGHSKITLSKPKNIFAPVRKFVPPPPPAPAPPAPAPAPLPPAPALPSPEELARERARRELSEFRYLGFFKKGPGKDQAFLARGRELFIVGEREPVAGSVYLKELSSSYVVLTEAGSQMDLTLRLSGD